MAKYRKLPVEVDAIQWRANEMLLKDVLDCFGGLTGVNANAIGKKQGKLVIRTLEGEMTVGDGDYIIKGVKNEFYPCKPDIFEQTYELAESAERMERYIVTTSKDCDKALWEVGNILYKPKFLSAIVGLESWMSADELMEIDGVTKVEKEAIGTFGTAD